jgi:hypothetical protein
MINATFPINKINEMINAAFPGCQLINVGGEFPDNADFF